MTNKMTPEIKKQIDRHANNDLNLARNNKRDYCMSIYGTKHGVVDVEYNPETKLYSVIKNGSYDFEKDEMIAPLALVKEVRKHEARRFLVEQVYIIEFND